MKNIRFDNVGFQYSNELTALREISLNIQNGEVLGIMGRNGAGKSTLIQLMNGLLKPTKGNVFFDGITTNEYDASILVQKIGIMFQNPEHQLFSSTVEEELNFSLKNLQISKDLKTQYKHEIIDELNLHSLLGKSPWNCSGGERKKISIACILCRKPEVLVFDEPTLGQDKGGYRILDTVINKAKQRKQTIIVVTHNTEFAYRYLDRLVVLENGRILADGPTGEILTNSIILENSSLIEPQIVKFKRLITESIPQQSNVSKLIVQARTFNEIEMIIRKSMGDTS
ncbi:MAG: ABC transporter ATP-binding protein [Promethearchaeota archaeon]|nr:MAG: ABC transporter ATP-binding protein [Candidatus Lokiarchaeota archaeon]